MKAFLSSLLACVCLAPISLVAESSQEVALPTGDEAAVVVSKSTEAAVRLDIQPRSEGAFWMYQSVYFEGELAHSNGSCREDVIEVKEVDGVRCHLVKLTLDWRSLMDRLSGVELTEDDYDYFWEYSNEQGSYNYSPDLDNPEALETLEGLDAFTLTMPYPVEKGHRYVADEMQHTVLDDQAEVTVRAGAFTCVVYLIEDLEPPTEDSTRERYYMAPGTGLVRWEMDSYLDGSWQLDSRDDLLKYVPGEVEASLVETAPAE